MVPVSKAFIVLLYCHWRPTVPILLMQRWKILVGAAVNWGVIGFFFKPNTCACSCASCLWDQLLAPLPPSRDRQAGRQHFVYSSAYRCRSCPLPSCLCPSLQRDITCQSSAITWAAGFTRPTSVRLGTARLGPPTLPRPSGQRFCQVPSALSGYFNLYAPFSSLSPSLSTRLDL